MPIFGLDFGGKHTSRFHWLKLWSLTALLHLLQPLGRLYGRLRNGLTLWRRQGTWASSFKFPRLRTSEVWSESWQAPEAKLAHIETLLKDQGAVVWRGGDYDRHDLEIRGGILGSVRIRMAIEEYGGGKQMAKFRSWPKIRSILLFSMLLFGVLSVAAAIDQEWWVFMVLSIATGIMMIRSLGDCASATAAFLYTLKQVRKEAKRDD